MPAFIGIDHIHVYVADREMALGWYKDVLGFTPMPEFLFWAEDGGPLTISNPENTIHLALFERQNSAPTSTIAFGATGEQFKAWKDHLDNKSTAHTLSDHDLSYSLYFTDPDDNKYEITTYDYAEAKAAFGSPA